MSIRQNPGLSLLSTFEPAPFCDYCDANLKAENYFCNGCGSGIHYKCLEHISRHSRFAPKCPKCVKVAIDPKRILKYACTICNDPSGMIFKKCSLIRPHVPFMNSDDYVHPSCLTSCARPSNHTNYLTQPCDLCDLPMEISGVACRQSNCQFRVHYRCLQLVKRQYGWAVSLKVSDLNDIEFDCPVHENLSHVDEIIQMFRAEHRYAFEIMSAVKRKYRETYWERKMSRLDTKLRKQLLAFQPNTLQQQPVSPINASIKPSVRIQPPVNYASEVNDWESPNLIGQFANHEAKRYGPTPNAQPLNSGRQHREAPKPSPTSRKPIVNRMNHAQLKIQTKHNKKTQPKNKTHPVEIVLESPAMTAHNSPNRNTDQYQVSQQANTNGNRIANDAQSFRHEAYNEPNYRNHQPEFEPNNQQFFYQFANQKNVPMTQNKSFDQQYPTPAYSRSNYGMMPVTSGSSANPFLSNTNRLPSKNQIPSPNGNFHRNPFIAPKPNSNNIQYESNRHQTPANISWYDSSPQHNDKIAERHNARFMAPNYGFGDQSERQGQPYRLQGLPPIQADAFGGQGYKYEECPFQQQQQYQRMVKRQSSQN
jgi:hypothetical protein